MVKHTQEFNSRVTSVTTLGMIVLVILGLIIVVILTNTNQEVRSRALVLPSPLPSPSESPTPVIGDANGDGVVDLSDIGITISNWLASASGNLDQYPDGKINVPDFTVVENGVRAQASPSPSTSPLACQSYASCRDGEICPEGTQCSGLPAYGCYPPGCPTPICLSSTTEIETPTGNVLVTQLHPGMLVWSVTKTGRKIVVPIVKTAKTFVGNGHQIFTINLADGRNVTVSGGHPTSNGLKINELKVGDQLDSSEIVSITQQVYKDSYTYDILPGSDTGFYFANNIVLGSTLKIN